MLANHGVGIRPTWSEAAVLSMSGGPVRRDAHADSQRGVGGQKDKGHRLIVGAKICPPCSTAAPAACSATLCRAVTAFPDPSRVS